MEDPMSEPAARQRLREAREKATAEREAAETQRPSMFRTAVEAAASVLPDVPTATVEQVALAVLRVALPLHETQHADAWKRAHERAVHFELELMKCADLNRSLVRENADMRVELERLRERLRRDPIRGTYYPAAEAVTAAEARMQAAFEAGEGDDDV